MPQESFLDWLEEESRRVEIEEVHLRTRFTRGPKEFSKSCASLDVATLQRVGQVVVWSSGECDTQVSDLNSDRTSTRLLKNQEELHRAVQEVIDACKVVDDSK